MARGDISHASRATTVPRIDRTAIPQPTRPSSTLRFFETSAQGSGADATGYNGVYYHFLDREGTGKILGATVVASHAGDLINEISLAMSAGLDLHALARVNQPYPTQSQAIKMAAGAYVASRRTSFRTWLMTKWLSW